MSRQQQTVPLKIAVIGAGLIGRRHAEGVLAEPRTALTAIIDPSDAARAFAASRKAAWFPTFAEATAREKPDGVIVATPNQLHVENAGEAIRAGIPTLIEKPIADQAERAAALVTAAEEAGVPILVGHHRRHNPMIQAAKNLLDNGRLGRVLTAHANFWVAKPDDYFDVAWRREAGGGPVLINLIHDVDLFRYLFGEVASVHAMQSSAARSHAVEDTAVILLCFENGVLATMNVCDAAASPWSWEMTSGENPAFPRQEQLCYQIGGTAGSLAIPQLTLWSNASQPNWLERLAKEHAAFTPADPLAIQLAHFCDVLSGTATPLVSGREGLATLRVIEAIKASALSGLTVRLSSAPAERGH